jgi:hypothetical protein
MPYFSSTAIRRAEYNEQTRTLSIWFTESGGPYDYYGVPASVYQGLLNARSKGTYFNDHIRDQYGH